MSEQKTCHNCVWSGEVEVCGTCNGPKDDNTLFAARRSVGTTVAFSERDPNGIAANQAGAKLDAGKNRLGLVLCGFSRALQEVGKVGTFGANKYTDNGWIEVPDGQRRYTDAMFRHVLKESAGETIDGDSGLLHAAHAAWNALARLDLMLRQGE